MEIPACIRTKQRVVKQEHLLEITIILLISTITKSVTSRCFTSSLFKKILYQENFPQSVMDAATAASNLQYLGLN